MKRKNVIRVVAALSFCCLVVGVFHAVDKYVTNSTIFEDEVEAVTVTEMLVSNSVQCKGTVLSPADVSAGLGTYCAYICDNCYKGAVRSMLPTESGTLASVDHVMCPYCKSILVYYAE